MKMRKLPSGWRCGGRGSGSPGAGFTLIELIVVLVLMLVMASIAVPYLAGQLGGAALRSAASDFVGMARVARATAVAGRKVVRLNVDPVNGRLYLSQEGAGGNSSGSVLGKRDLSPDVFFSLETRTTGRVAAPFSLQFRADGTAEEALVTLEHRSGRNVKVRVEKVTGRAWVEATQ
jgi:type II secretion system protein H